MNTMDLPEKAQKQLREIRKKYKVAFEPLTIRDEELQILTVTDLEHLLGGKDPFANVQEFPFWIRLWESALVLADLIVSMPPDKPGQKLLELGAGLGAPGLAAAKAGYQVTLSDYEQHILEFQRVSAAASNLKGVQCKLIDWLKPPQLTEFDTIIAAEVLFREEFFAPLLNVFKTYLAPGGVIYLAHEACRKSLPKFLDLAEKEYDIAFSNRKFRKDDIEKTIVVCRLTQKA